MDGAAQDRPRGDGPDRPATPTADGPVIRVPADTMATKEGSVSIGGQRVPYRVTTGTQPVWDDAGQPIASVFYVYYERSDVRDRSRRPLVISFNGGPGSASVWMHVGYTSPKLLAMDPEGFPVQPYGVRDNPHSILDVADIVYVDPVNTGFSRILNDADREQFFGVNEDVEYLASWIDTFVSRRGRWTSPKFLIGESYGTTRVSGLAARLQGAHWMFLNGVILVSPTQMGVEREGPVGDALMLPHYTATAWYHDALTPELQTRDLEELLAEVEAFTLDEYLPALSRGGALSPERRAALAARVARYAGLDPDFVVDYNLAPPVTAFRKELLRDRGLTVGRLDARYRGVDRMDAGESYDFDPALTAWNHAFAPAINHYLRDDLGWETDLQYWIFGPVHPWNRSGDRTGENLRQAMAQNPFLHIMVQSGYFDGGTDYFGAKYTMWNMDPAGRLQDRMRFHGYRSGHMMYLRDEDLGPSNQHIRDFIAWATENTGRPARY
ncbi:MAG: carboxypeptidase [Gemmatimonadetes bacterium]|nr:carboxypeptidase [Gemmatimonadota bacterium]